MKKILLAILAVFLVYGDLSARKHYEGRIPPQSGQFFKNRMCEGPVSIADCRRDTPAGRMVATAIQGLANREVAQTYLYLADHHLRQFGETGREIRMLETKGYGRNPGLRALFAEYAPHVKKIYVWNPEEDWTWNMALMLSVRDQGIPVMKDQLDELLTAADWDGTVEELGGRWETRESAYYWAISELMPTAHPTIMFSVGLRSDWTHNPWILYDYVVASGGFAFWLNDSDPADQAVIEDICKAGRYKPGSTVMGYAQSGDDLLYIVNKYGIGYVVSDYYANASFWCAYPNKSFRQRPGKAIKAEPGKVYVSVTLSDGDNIQFDQNALYDIWTKDPARGRVPIGTTMAAGLQELNPFLLEWFYANMTDNDELMAGPSGFQFIYGRDYQKEGYEKWLDLNRKWLASAGFHTGCFWHTTYGTDTFERYIETSGLKGIFDGDDRVIIDYRDGVMVFNQGDHLYGDLYLYNNVVRRYKEMDKTRPLFINTYPMAGSWGHGGFTRLEREMEQLEKDYPGVFVFLLPKDLAATASKYYKKHPEHRPVSAMRDYVPESE